MLTVVLTIGVMLGLLVGVIALFGNLTAARASKNIATQLTQLAAVMSDRERAHGDLKDSITHFLLEQKDAQSAHRVQLSEQQQQNLRVLTESLQSAITGMRGQILDFLKTNGEHIGKNLDKLTQVTSEQLKEISGQVEKRLHEGFEKTTATFTDVLKRLALIDEAQKRITEISNNIVSLEEILNDKRSRGAFGEVQLSALVSNMLPEDRFALQHQLSNGKRADCILFLPPPTGNIVVDAKFPLESFQIMRDTEATDEKRKNAEQQFRLDVRKHIRNIAEKYIVAGETADGAVMFIPAEAVFAEIHARYPDLVEESHRLRVWMVSPTTMMALLNMARAVLKDAATRKEVHVIQEHLRLLGEDFGRFQKRMDNLVKHVEQAHGDVEEVRRSSQKITDRFGKIERVELSDGE